MNSREKGKRGERQWRDELRANGYHARRGQQFAGGTESPDVVCHELDCIHFEVKAVERLNIEDAMEQARRDAASESKKQKAESREVAAVGTPKIPVVAHKRNHRPWLVTMEASTFFQLLRSALPPSNGTDGTKETDAGARLTEGALKCVPAEARPVRHVQSVPNHFGKVSGASPDTARETRALPSTKTTEQTEQ